MNAVGITRLMIPSHEVDRCPALVSALILNVFASCQVYPFLFHIIAIIAEGGFVYFPPPPQWRGDGPSPPLRVLLPRRDTGHMRSRCSPAGLRSSVPASPLSHRLISVLS